MKRKIILFLLNLIGGKKNQETEEETHSRRLGCGADNFELTVLELQKILVLVCLDISRVKQESV